MIDHPRIDGPHEWYQQNRTPLRLAAASDEQDLEDRPPCLATSDRRLKPASDAGYLSAAEKPESGGLRRRPINESRPQRRQTMAFLRIVG